MPYSRSVVEINYTLEAFIEKNFAYWQFLLSKTSDFLQVSESCDRIFQEAIEIIEQNIMQSKVMRQADSTKGKDGKISEVALAQCVKDIDYMKMSFPFFSKLIVRRATHGVGKLSIAQISLWFKLKAEDEYEKVKRGLEKLI